MKKHFSKYKDEPQKFIKGEKVQFKFGTKGWKNNEKVENTEWWEGTIHTISRLANGQYKYVVRYLEPADGHHYDMNQIDETGQGISFTNPITKKNIRKL